MIKTRILDTDYEVELADLNNPMMADHDGLCFQYQHKIVLRKPELLFMNESDEVKQTRFREVLLHELVHSFCRQCGVFYDDNENLVDWIALMIPKIVRAYDDILRQLKEQEEIENQS